MISKTVIVTGASRGIGRDTASLLAYNGYNVIANYNNSYEDAVNLQESLKENGYCIDIFRADVRDRKQVSDMVEFAKEKYGRVDVLVNNAGISQDKLFIEITEEEWEKMFDVNVKGTYNCTQECLKDMIRNKRGKIINISSIFGVNGGSMAVHYSSAKSAIIGFTKALAKELGPSNIQVNCIAPGYIVTDMTSVYSEETQKLVIEETPLKRLGNPRDISNMILYLSSDKSDFITGQVININGGRE